MAPAFLAVLPGLIAGLAGARDRECPPGLLSSIEVGAVDPATNAVFAAGRTDDGHVANDQWCQRDRFGDGGFRDLAFPHLFAGRLVEREHAAVERDRNDLVLPERDAAVVDAATGDVASPGLIGFGIEFPAEGAFLAAGQIN